MKIMVLDGNSIVNRAFYGVRPLSTKDGTPTNAVFGFLNILTKLLAEEEPEALCVTFDLKAPTFRHEQYEGYKAQRKGMPDELAAQMPILKDVLDAMCIPRYELSGFEADDLIGTISAKCEGTEWDCVIVTGDKDSFQLITDKTSVKHVKSRMGQTETKTYTPDVFMEEYGFEPAKIIDLKALMGDSSDNIPGVPGVGEKTAMDLVRRFGSIDALYHDLDSLDIKDSVRKKLAAGEESAQMSYELARIHKDAPISFAFEENLRRPAKNDALYALFQKLEFAKLTEKFGLVPPQASQAPAANGLAAEIPFAEVASQEEAEAMAATLSAADFCALRCSDGLDTVAICCEGHGYLLQAASTPGYGELFKTIFSGQIKKAGHDIKRTMRLLLAKGLACEGWVSDISLGAYLIEPTANSYDLPRLSELYCGKTLFKESEEESGQMSFLSGQDTVKTLISEAQAIHCLKGVIEEKVTALGMWELYSNIELPLCAVLAEMEHIGFLVDKNALEQFGAMLAENIKGIEKTIYEMAGEEFNVGSPKQLSYILFDKLLLPAPKKTKTGYSTNVEVLEYLKNKHPIIQQILDYRELTKLKSTYADGLLKVIGSDGRIHTHFQMTVTATGRLSSTEPNLQNIPVRRELGGEIRKMFIAGPGKTLCDADYSQIELRLLADISGDETMKSAFLSGEDIHTVTASQVFGVPLDEVTAYQRSSAKAVNFGIVYGISPFSLSQDIGVSVAEAKQYMENYLSKYHGVRDYMKNIVEKAKKDGYVSTLYGRRRNLPELKASNFNIRSFGERVALNTPIQGTAADVIKIAMINVHKTLREENLTAKLILQVHDELIVECPENEVEKVKEILCREMEGAAKLSIPLIASASTGHSWYEAK